MAASSSSTSAPSLLLALVEELHETCRSVSSTPSSTSTGVPAAAKPILKRILEADAQLQSTAAALLEKRHTQQATRELLARADTRQSALLQHA